MPKLGDDSIALVPEADQFRSPLDRNAHRRQPVDQQALVLVLGKDPQRGVRGQADADLLEGNASLAPAARPKVDRGNLMGSCDDVVGEIELTVKLERAGLNGERSRSRARFAGLVHDPHFCAELCQPEGQDEAGWAGADHQNVATRHFRLLIETPLACIWSTNPESPSRFPRFFQRRVSMAKDARTGPGTPQGFN